MTDKYARVWSGSEWVNVSAPIASPTAVVVYQSSAPTSPVTGQVWIDSDDGVSYVWSGSAWVITGGSGASVTTSDASPLSPEVGDMWFETDSGLLYVYYDSYWIEVSGASYMQPQETSMTIALSDESTAITTGTAKLTMRAPFAMTLTKTPRASLSTASTSGIPTVDINKNSTSIFSTKLTIDANEKTSTTAATPAVLSTTSIADDEELTFDIDVAGTGAKGLKITIYYEKT